MKLPLLSGIFDLNGKTENLINNTYSMSYHDRKKNLHIR